MNWIYCLILDEGLVYKALKNSSEWEQNVVFPIQLAEQQPESLKSTDGNCFTPVSSSALFYFVFLFWLASLQEHNLFKSRKEKPEIIYHPMKLTLFFSNVTLRNVTSDCCPAKRQSWRLKGA